MDLIKLCVVIALSAVLSALGCNRDGACWAPQDGQQGAGGGPVIPVGQGGFGEEPDPEPQGDDGEGGGAPEECAKGEWYCHGYIGPCLCEDDRPAPHQCGNAYGRGTVQWAAKRAAKQDCDKALTTTASQGICLCSDIYTAKLVCAQDK